MMIVLRVGASGLDVSECLTWVPQDLVETTWTQGERSYGRVATTSGFALALDRNDASLKCVEEQLGPLIHNLRDLREQGADIELDIGLEVQGVSPTSVCVPPSVLRLLEAIGATLVVTGYPVSD